MFYFDDLLGNKVLRSDFIENAFFTLRNPLPEIWQNEIFTKFKADRVITPNQTHSDNVQIADERQEYPETDGLILNKAKTLMYLRFADCTPLVFHDKKNNIYAISHAGWRGTASMIGVRTVLKMSEEFGSKAENIAVVIGPAISKCCYEVGEEVKEKLLATVKNKNELFNDNFVDLKKINAKQLNEIGVQNIDICPYCTSCSNDLFYSYRKENGTKNRHFAVIIT